LNRPQVAPTSTADHQHQRLAAMTRTPPL
jgi:hypothetical protein